MSELPVVYCDEMLFDHLDRGDTTCEDPGHRDALARRRGGAKPWSPIERSRDGGGSRDFLDGRPIHCGTGLLLQIVERKDDDYGGYNLHGDRGLPVRYELSGGAIVLYVDYGGHDAILTHNAWMRFRWPPK